MEARPEQLKELHLWTDGSNEPGDLEPLKPYLRHTPAGAQILDIGCGDGRVLRRLLAEGYRAEGLDLNAELVAHCVAGGLPVTQGDAREVLPRWAGKFEVYSMLDFVEHIPMDALLEILGIIARQKGARIWIQTPNLDSVMGFKFWFHMPSHVLPLHPHVLRKLLARLGYRIISEWTDYGGLPWTGFRRWLSLKILNGLLGPPQAELFVGGANICLVAEAIGTF